MKSFMKPILAAIVAISVIATVNESMAQESGVVAVLDVAKVFKENAAFDSRMKAIKAEADQLKTQIQGEQQTIKEAAMGVSQYEAGTTQRNEMEAKIEQDQAALRTRARQAEAQLLNREAKIYYDTYQQLQAVVGQLAEANNIALVLRFDGEPIDATNRGEVIKGVNRSVVYFSKIDLTNLVMQAMDTDTANAGGNMQR